jgi:hypothetical protein
VLLRPQRAAAQVNLFDLHHKYADVMGVERVVGELGKRS